MTPLVSILIPAYNAERWISDSIQSALDQRWPTKEIIVVDDGSTDQTLSAARRFESAQVRVVTQANQGAAAARNRAYALCQGEYIQWLDADDLLGANKISAQMKVCEQLKDPRTLLSSAWGIFYYRPERARFSPSPLWADLSPVEWLRRKLEQDCFMQTATWLVSRELTDAAGPWNTRLLGDDDGEYFCRVLCACSAVKFVPESRVFYRDAGSNRLSHVGLSPKKLSAHFLSMQLHIGYLRSLADDEKTRIASLRYLQRYMYHFYHTQPDIVLQMEKLANELGGALSPPHVRRKYLWIQKLWGWDVAKRAQLFFPQIRGSLEKTWDKALFRLKGPRATLVE